MSASKIAVRYGKAIFETAQDKNCVDQVLADLEGINNALKSDVALSNFLINPVISVSKKKDIFLNGLKGKVHDITIKSLQLIFDKKREKYIPFIIINFIDRFKKANNVQTLQVITAVPLNNELQNKLTSQVLSDQDSRVDLKMQVNENIIGGYVVRINDLLFDASVKNQLKKFELALSKSI